MRLVPNMRTVARVYHAGLGAAVISVRRVRTMGQSAQAQAERSVEKWQLGFTRLSEEGRTTTERVLDEAADSTIGKRYTGLRDQLDEQLASWREHFAPTEWATKNSGLAAAKKAAAKKTAVQPSQGGVIIGGP